MSHTRVKKMLVRCSFRSRSASRQGVTRLFLSQVSQQPQPQPQPQLQQPQRQEQSTVVPPFSNPLSALFSAFRSATKSVLTTPTVVPSHQTWQQAISEAEKLVHLNGGGSTLDPRSLVGRDLSMITSNIKKLVGSGHPLLNTISNYYFEQGGKHFRPLIVLLMSRALNPEKLDVSQSQRNLAEIAEMIHTASLLHDDVIDVADTRRNQPSANVEFGNKLAVLAGDFLLAKASMALARLKNVEVVELLAVVIGNLVEGEFMQMRAERERAMSFDYYMQKTYLKTATLIARSCEAAALLAGSSTLLREAAYQYGRNLGLAFQLIDDLLDFTGTTETLGKPAAADLSLGLATAPVLFAAEMFPQLIEPIRRQFQQSGDVQLARELVFKSDGLQRTRQMAEEHCRLAVNAASQLPPSPARSALINLTAKVLTRDK